MMKFVTETGSVYEVDQAGRRLRRLSGYAAPTANITEDGRWRTFLHVGPLEHGRRVFVIWGLEHRDKDGLKLRQTLTSEVTNIKPE
jgi:hypothetical protein